MNKIEQVITCHGYSWIIFGLAPPKAKPLKLEVNDSSGTSSFPRSAPQDAWTDDEGFPLLLQQCFHMVALAVCLAGQRLPVPQKPTKKRVSGNGEVKLNVSGHARQGLRRIT